MRRRKTRVPGKSLFEHGENQQQTQPVYDVGSENRTQAILVGDQRSHHHPCSQKNPRKRLLCCLDQRASEKFDSFCFYCHCVSRYQDDNTQAFFMVVSCNRWLAVRLDLLSSAFVTIVAVGAILITENPGELAKGILILNS